LSGRGMSLAANAGALNFFRPLPACPAGEEAWATASGSLFTRRMNRRGPDFCYYPLWLLSLYTCRTAEA
jgi:hypothetical protein